MAKRIDAGIVLGVELGRPSAASRNPFGPGVNCVLSLACLLCAHGRAEGTEGFYVGALGWGLSGPGYPCRRPRSSQSSCDGTRGPSPAEHQAQRPLHGRPVLLRKGGRV